MPPHSAKKSSTKGKASPKNPTAAQAARLAKKEAELQAITEWIEKNDPLLDAAPTAPISIDTLLSSKLAHKTFSKPGAGEMPYDWSAFREVLESRDASSPRWFVQLREEDLLLGPDGLDGVVVDCFVIAEASVPTLSPAQYVVKTHWPFSDIEDNAPERILPLEGQKMCWRRVVKSDGTDINVYMLQKRSDPSGPAPAASFGFGATTTPTAAPATSATPTPSFGFGFGSTTAPAVPISFGFGASAAVPAAPQFGFGTAAPAALATAPATQFGFGAATAAAGTPISFAGFGAPAVVATSDDADGVHVKVVPLKTTEIYFSLWSKKRLTEMAKEVRSGSRIVREDFLLDAATKIKLVMQNDRKDDVVKTVRRLILNRLFAKRDDEVKEMDKWIDECPVYDEELAPALQEFRERRINELADESELFEELYSKYHDAMGKELERIVAIREKAAGVELNAIESILEEMKEHKLAEKESFRLLKYYPKNDVQPFRPFGKISGISEMGEMVDVCVPPAHVNINPFTKKAI